MTSACAIGDGDRLKIRAVAAPAKLDTATPNRINASGARIALDATINRPPASAAPAKADISISPGTAAAPRTMASAAPSAAVADTPSTPGSASGLRNSPCMTAPASPRAAPTTRAQTARGARTCHRTSAGPDAGSPKAAPYCAPVNVVSPIRIASARAATISKPRIRHSRTVPLMAAPRPSSPPHRRRTRPGRSGSRRADAPPSVLAPPDERPDAGPARAGRPAIDRRSPV